jgi:Flp pilus assembly protein TadD
MARLSKTPPDQASAESDLKKAIEVAPKNSTGFTRLGALRLVQKRNAEAEKLFDQALSLNPADFDALQSLVGLDLLQKHNDRALERVKAQIARAPNSAALYSLEGTLLFNVKNYDAAESALKKAADLDTSNPMPLLLLGQVQAAKGSVDEAIASYQKSVQQNPTDVRAYLILGTLEEKRSDWKKAESYYQQALRVQPDYPAAANNLAYLMLEHGENSDVALSLAQIARQRLPNSPIIADTLGWAYYTRGAYSLAIQPLEEAVQSNPTDATSQFHLGMAYAKSGRTTQARLHLERALQLEPKFSHAEEARSVLSSLAGR